MRKGCLFKTTTSLFFFLSEIKKGERTHATKTLCQTAQKDDVERRRGRDEEERERGRRWGEIGRVVGFDREERRYNFHSYFAEIECD